MVLPNGFLVWMSDRASYEFLKSVCVCVVSLLHLTHAYHPHIFEHSCAYTLRKSITLGFFGWLLLKVFIFPKGFHLKQTQ